MHLLLKRLYGSSSEKFDPRQGVLFDAQAAEEEATVSPPAPPPVVPSVPKHRDRHGRGRIPEKIQREEVVHDLSEAEMTAMGGAENLVELPSEQSEQLDWRPSTLFVIVHVRKKYARKMPLPESGLTLAEQNVAVARKPPEAIPGALAAPGLMSQVIVSKGADHLPLHRLEGIFKRQGLRISRQTMDGWWLATAEFLQPLYALAVRVVLASHVIHTDDTSVKVRDAWQKRKYTGRFWPYVGDPLHPLTVFDFTTTHQRDGPAAFLKDYRGYLQADAFSGYDGIYLESQGRIIEVACWAHARRKYPREPTPGFAAHGDGISVDQQALRGRKGPARALPGRVEDAHRWRSAPHGSPPSGRSGLGRCFAASTPGWKRKHGRSCPRARFVGRWTTR